MTEVNIKPYKTSNLIETSLEGLKKKKIIKKKQFIQMKTIRIRRKASQPDTEKSSAPFFLFDSQETEKKDDAFFQSKTTTSHHDDQFEKEAETVEEKVQKKGVEDEDKTKSGVQVQDDKREETIRKSGKKEEDKKAPKAIPEKKEEDTPAIHKKEMEPVKDKDDKLMKAAKPGKASARPATKTSVEELVNRTKGKGFALPKDVCTIMEMQLKVDLASVRIHTDADAVSLNNELHSLAFTTGYDIYFNEGLYQPYTVAGQVLLAHELTHVIQQKGLSPKKIK